MNCCDGNCNQGRDCPYRGTITMSEGNKQWMLGMVAGVVITSLIAIALSKMNPVLQAVEMPKDIIQSYNMGIKDALRTNPASNDLEMVCLELWGKK
jgi:hypothetical protein